MMMPCRHVFYTVGIFVLTFAMVFNIMQTPMMLLEAVILSVGAVAWCLMTAFIIYLAMHSGVCDRRKDSIAESFNPNPGTCATCGKFTTKRCSMCNRCVWCDCVG